jgi:hypothetical protein
MQESSTNRRVILVYWKTRSTETFEVFSNLKHFISSYPEYSYNTLNNYLSKEKKPYENEIVRVERMPVRTKPIFRTSAFRMIPVVQKRQLHSFNEAQEDLAYWQSRSAKERMAAVTFIISQTIAPGSRLDKTMISKRELKS